jgi:hypothetical protein
VPAAQRQPALDDDSSNTDTLTLQSFDTLNSPAAGNSQISSQFVKRSKSDGDEMYIQPVRHHRHCDVLPYSFARVYCP